MAKDQEINIDELNHKDCVHWLGIMNQIKDTLAFSHQPIDPQMDVVIRALEQRKAYLETPQPVVIEPGAEALMEYAFLESRLMKREFSWYPFCGL